MLKSGKRKSIIMIDKNIIDNINSDIKCDCRICRRSKDLLKVLESDSIEFVKAYLKETFTELMTAEFDLDYYKCILDGSWTSAERILKESLEKAKNHPNRKLE